MVWYSHLFKNFPQFVVICTVKDFSIVNEAKVDIFMELSCLFGDPVDVGNVVSEFMVHVLLKPGLENFEHYFASV